METITLEKRTVLGKKNRDLLAQGFIPAVIYNAKGESTNVQVDASAGKKLVKVATSTTIFEAKQDDKSSKVLIKDVDLNPVTDVIRHISFFEIDENKEMVFSIPFEIIGISPAVKNNLGILVKVLADIDVRCKLADLVPSITVDISSLDHPGQIVGVHDIKLPEGMELMNKDLEQATIVTITEIQKEEEVVVAAPVEGETAEGETPAEATPEEEKEK
ncbi:MAG: 50S ribosomal protein L25 [candidate division WS6 bacterium GW2011_GWC2_36_7]|nr:MAG: 50S ribosomal protein L25 [candidate division WS6 bacterium GW2011_WS6_36_26]KKQ12244.1 MAG: 50S ribosomal protein L25 [candidate division WS6 bacterium GW2011_GWC2_36_7]HAM37537.1 50S ribosomal protein L25 [Patescibacteria group bacterium]HAM96676.1 50S ribosomal protein L25 [Patescibacteria group bacterium]